MKNYAYLPNLLANHMYFSPTWGLLAVPAFAGNFSCYCEHMFLQFCKLDVVNVTFILSVKYMRFVCCVDILT